MYHPSIAYACFVIIALSSLARGDDWGQFRGPDFGRASQTNIAETWDTEGVQWKTPLPGRGASSPVVFGDHIYLTAYTGYAIDKQEPGDPKLLVRHLLCLDVNTGKLLWQKSIADDSTKDKFATWGTAKAGYASSSAAVDASGVYVLFGATGVVAFNHNGDQKWRKFCGDDVVDYPAGNSPIIYKELVIVNASYEGGDLIAFNKADGSEAWRQEEITKAWNTPIVYKSANGEDELAVSAINEIRAFDPQTGKPRWKCTGVDEYVCPSLIAQDGVLYTIGGKKGVAIAVRSGGEGDVTEFERFVTRVPQRLPVLGQRARRCSLLRQRRNWRTGLSRTSSTGSQRNLRHSIAGGGTPVLHKPRGWDLRRRCNTRVQTLVAHEARRRQLDLLGVTRSAGEWCSVASQR